MDFELFLALSIVGGLVGAGAVYTLARRDLGARRALLVAVATFLALGLGWWWALYGAVVGVVAAILVYALARSRFGTSPALAAAGGSYLVIVAGFATLIWYATTYTM